MNTNMPTAAPARKVVASTAGAGVGVVSAQLVVWGLDEYVFEPEVASSVPGPVEAFVMLVIPLVLAFASGYLTPRASSELQPQHRA
jgi:hypothetical protein